MFCKRLFSSIYRERNRLKTIYFKLICSEKDLQKLRKSLPKQIIKTDFRFTPKRKEPLGLCRLDGRPVRSAVRPAGIEPLGLGRPTDRPSSRRKHSFPKAVDRSADRENPRANCFQSVDRSVGRQTCTSVHVLDTWSGQPVRSAGLAWNRKLGRNFEHDNFWR